MLFILKNIKHLVLNSECTLKISLPYNNPDVQEITNIASNGIGTARGLASAISAILTVGSEK